MSTTRPPRAIIYTRQSSYREESISLELQETTGREFCARHGYRVVDVIADPGVSGLKWDKRPGIQQAVKRVQAGDAERVIVWRWSRLSRQRLHQQLALDAIEKAGGQVESATEPFDTTTAGGEFGRDVMLAAASFESRQKGEQWKDALERRHSHGLPGDGRARFGYVRDGEFYVIDEDEAGIVQWMYASYLSGMGIPTLVRELGRNGVRNKHDQPWKAKGLTAYMESGFAAGLIVNGVRQKGSDSPMVPFAERTWLPGAHEPIIDEVTWHRYQAVKQHRDTVPPRDLNPTHTLSGLVRCSCGGTMSRRATGVHGRYATFGCQRRRAGEEVPACNIQEWRLIASVKEWLGQIADQVGDEAEQAAEAQQLQLQSRTDADKAAQEVAEIDKQLESLTRQLVAGRVPESTYDATRDALLADRSAAEQRRALAEAQAVEPRRQPASAIAQGLLDEWDVLSVLIRRALLSELIASVRVTPGDHARSSASVQVIPLWDRS